MTAQEASERVARGAALLDQQRPGWADRIILNRLRLADCAECVLGQCFGSYGDGVLSLDYTGSLVDAGFDLRIAEATREAFAILQAAWIEAINERVNAAAPVATWTHREQVQA